MWLSVLSQDKDGLCVDFYKRINEDGESFNDSNSFLKTEKFQS